MIALLFALVAVAMVLAWFDRWRPAYYLFAVTILLSIYWFDYHGTTSLEIVL